jgi:hypothetical protein
VWVWVFWDKTLPQTRSVEAYTDDTRITLI